MRRERADHTLQTTALINEAYLKLRETNGMKWQNRAQFFAISAIIMRRILINYARDSKAQKRGGKDALHINLEDAEIFSPEKSRQLIELDEALKRLGEFDETKSRIVEMRYFGGMSIEGDSARLSASRRQPCRCTGGWHAPGCARNWKLKIKFEVNENY